ncbi:MAG: hypothetical protein LBO06_02960 [Bacteroidales bacterium]|jgi:hypothetical protein|nr:hypothetical protein [Bacteroidales bacterium]
MKRKIINIIIASIAMIGFSACNNNDEDKYPKDIAIADYIKFESTCSINNMNAGIPIIVNSVSELYQHIDSTCMYDMPNFNQHSLILVAGCVGYSIKDIQQKLEKVSDNKYNLYLYVNPSNTMCSPCYYKVLVTDKLPNNATITAQVTHHSIE